MNILVVQDIDRKSDPTDSTRRSSPLVRQPRLDQRLDSHTLRQSLFDAPLHPDVQDHSWTYSTLVSITVS